MHEHRPVVARYDNIECSVCGKLFVRNNAKAFIR